MSEKMVYNWKCPINDGLPSGTDYVWVAVNNRKGTKTNYYMCFFKMREPFFGLGSSRPAFITMNTRTELPYKRIIGWAPIHFPQAHQHDSQAYKLHEARWVECKTEIMGNGGYSEEDLDDGSIEDRVNRLTEIMFTLKYGFNFNDIKNKYDGK